MWVNHTRLAANAGLWVSQTSKQWEGAQNIRVLVSHTRVPLSCAPPHVLLAEKGNFPMGSTTKSCATTSQQPAFDYVFLGRPFLAHGGCGDFSKGLVEKASISKLYFMRSVPGLRIFY